jgi:hypothetical protein
MHRSQTSSNGMKTLRLFAAAVAVMLAAFAAPDARAQKALRISANTPVGTLDPVKMPLGALEYNHAIEEQPRRSSPQLSILTPSILGHMAGRQLIAQPYFMRPRRRLLAY